MFRLFGNHRLLILSQATVPKIVLTDGPDVPHRVPADAFLLSNNLKNSCRLIFSYFRLGRLLEWLFFRLLGEDKRSVWLDKGLNVFVVLSQINTIDVVSENFRALIETHRSDKGLYVLRKTPIQHENERFLERQAFNLNSNMDHVAVCRDYFSFCFRSTRGSARVVAYTLQRWSFLLHQSLDREIKEFLLKIC